MVFFCWTWTPGQKVCAREDVNDVEISHDWLSVLVPTFYQLSGPFPSGRVLGFDASIVIFSFSMVFQKESLDAYLGTAVKYWPSIARISEKKRIFT